MPTISRGFACLRHVLASPSLACEQLCVFVVLSFQKCDVAEDGIADAGEWVEGTVDRVPEGIRDVHSQDGAVVLDVRYGHMFNLNLVGSKIVELLRCGYSDCQIVEEISRRFAVSQATVKSDLQEFLDSLEKHRLVVRSTDELP